MSRARRHRRRRRCRRCCRRRCRRPRRRRPAGTPMPHTGCARTRAACAPWRTRARSGRTSTCALTIRFALSAVSAARSSSGVARIHANAARRTCTDISECTTAAGWSADGITVKRSATATPPQGIPKRLFIISFCFFFFCLLQFYSRHLKIMQVQKL